ncbi:hypothetical protein F5Y17DRAFT_250172 [Xylariaceae sp. FL0594]|nr:hypothetical protein F5Y17DRAFT_250172 [Xylariaceae sp. FL0594]
MSLGSGNVELNQTSGRNYRPNRSPDSPPPQTESQVTIVHDPRPYQSNSQASYSQMTAIPYSPSAPTLPSVASNEEIYGPERYSGHQRQRYYAPSYYAASPPRPNSMPSSTIEYAPQTAFVMMSQTNPLVQRDFKDDLTRAAGTVTPGVSDAPYIRYALEALTSRGNHDSESSNDDVFQSRHQVIPQYSVNVTRPPPVRRSQVASFVNPQEEEVPVILDNRSVPPKGTLEAPRMASNAVIIPKRVEQGRASFPPPTWQQQPRSQSQLRQEEAYPQQLQQRPQQQKPAEGEFNPYMPRLDQIAQYFNHAIALSGRGPATSSEPNRNHNPPRTVDTWRSLPPDLTRQDLNSQGLRNFGVPPTLTHKPWILRPLPLLLLAGACLFMIAALVFSAVYSIGREGFTPYSGSITGGQYFVFRVLPQLVGALILVYAQAVIGAVFRVYPLSAMASEDRHERRGAVFLPMYATRTFIVPQLFGPWNVWVPTLVVWLANFSIPLLSTLYTVVLVDDQVWTWTTVQGVAWTLVALYVALLLATVVIFAFWRARTTGMVDTWDVRSIADVIFLVAQSNSLPRYRGLETATSRKQMRAALAGTAPERLGYWCTPEVPENGVFWSIGVPTTEEDIENEKWDRRHDGQNRLSNTATPQGEDLEKGVKEPWAARHRYLPWCFRDSVILPFVTICTALLIAFIAVSFTHSTDVRNGFLPLLGAAPLAGAFSPADFLYAFIPSLVGMLFYLVFQSLDTHLRILSPWGELARDDGSRAETSLLLDYAACHLPWEATIAAVRHRHWRVALVSFLSPLFVLMPVFGGGLFMALTPATRVVRMYPNVPLLALLISLSVLYVAALATLVPKRHGRLGLPHAVTCLAEVMSFCCNEQLRTDEAFDQTRSPMRSWFRGALDKGRWTFGAGKSGEERLGVKRLGSKYTTTTLRQYVVSGKNISAPRPMSRDTR